VRDWGALVANGASVDGAGSTQRVQIREHGGGSVWVPTYPAIAAVTISTTPSTGSLSAADYLQIRRAIDQVPQLFPPG